MSTVCSKSLSDHSFGPSIEIFSRLLRLIRLLRFVSISCFCLFFFMVFMAERLRSMEALLTGRPRKIYTSFTKSGNNCLTSVIPSCMSPVWVFKRCLYVIHSSRISSESMSGLNLMTLPFLFVSDSTPYCSQRRTNLSLPYPL